MVGIRARGLAVPAALAGTACLIVVVTGLRPAGRPAPTGPALTGVSTHLDDEVEPLREGMAAWRTYWALCWGPYEGATGYEIRTLTGEGASSRLVRQQDRCFRVEAAAGTSTPEDRPRARAQLLATQEGQLALQVRAVLGRGGRSEWSAPVAVGSG